MCAVSVRCVPGECVRCLFKPAQWRHPLFPPTPWMAGLDCMNGFVDSSSSDYPERGKTSRVCESFGVIFHSF